MAPGPHRLHPNAAAALGTPPRRELTPMRRRRLCLAAACTPTRLPRWGPRRRRMAAGAPGPLSDYITLARRRPPGETIQVERREIETRIAAGDHVREDASCGRRMLKPVAAEAVDQEQ